MKNIFELFGEKKMEFLQKKTRNFMEGLEKIQVNTFLEEIDPEELKKEWRHYFPKTTILSISMNHINKKDGNGYTPFVKYLEIHWFSKNPAELFDQKAKLRRLGLI